MYFELAVCLPRDAETVGLVRTVLSNSLRSFGVAEPCVDDIRLALSEACTNVIDHAAAEDDYEVRLELDEGRCAISVTNTGSGFDAAALAGVPPDQSSARGRGVAIMHAVMDAVDLTSEPTRGTIVYLVKSLEIDPDSPFARIRQRTRNQA